MLLKQVRFFLPIMENDDMTEQELDKLVEEKLMPSDIWQLCDEYYKTIIRPLVRGRAAHYAKHGKPAVEAEKKESA